jgi:serine protease Do
MLSKKLLKPTLLAAALTVTLACGGFANTSLNPVPEAHAQVAAALPDFSQLVEDNGKAVVSIATVKKAKNFTHPNMQLPDEQLEMLRRFGFPMPFGDSQPRRTPERRGQGSGFIISADGLILTNHHVVDGADELKVQLTDKREFTAKVLGSDAKTDVAVIKIDAKNLPVVKIGNSDKVKVGEWVAAIGAPFGLNNTVTAGIVSAKSRNLPDDQFVPFIQTDVAVNPGNSGGPLFNMKGEVIGINSQIFSTSGGFMGLSFAIPIDLAVKIKDQLVKDGKISRGRVGVVIQTLTPELAGSFGIKDAKGALIAQIEKEGPADKAGLNEGDIILEFNGKPIEEARDLSLVVADTKPGTKAKVKVLRENKEKVLEITVGELADKSGVKTAAQAPEKSRLGVTVRPLNEMEKKKISNGVVVESAEGPAAEAGITKGDVIISAGGKKIKSFDDLKAVLEKAGDTVAILVDRKGSRIFVPVKLNSDK